MKQLLRPWLINFGILLIFIIGAIAYTWPGAQGLWEGRTDLFMSDGTDLTVSPFHFDLLHRQWLKDPSSFFYGGFPNARLDAPEGFVAWYAPVEKIAGALFPFFAPVEQVSVLLALSMMVLSALCFYGMGRAFGWERLLSLSLAIGWAFSAQMRARAQVHAALVGTFALPLAIWGLLILRQDRSWKGILKGAICFLICATSPHYYIIFLAFFSPFFLVFYFSGSGWKSSIGRKIFRLLGAALPAVLFLLMSLLRPVPADFAKHVNHVKPITGQSNVWPHPFLKTYSAHFRDYFAGDIAIGSNDWNPLRAMVSDSIRQDPEVGNFHEHAVGIRWVLWILFGASLIYYLRRRKTLDFSSEEKAIFFVFLGLGVFSFLCSLPPDWGLVWGPSAWIYGLIEQVRVPSRIAIFPTMSLLIIVGMVTHRYLSQKKFSMAKRQGLLALLAFVMVMDFPPALNSMPMAGIVPSLAPLVDLKAGPCGTGMYFPNASDDHQTILFYYLLQSLRGTDCSVLNAASPGTRNEQMAQIFGFENQKMIQSMLHNESELKDQIVRFSQCNPLDWIVFDSRVPEVFARDVCERWKGKWMGQNFCRSQKPFSPIAYGRPEACLSQARSF